MNETIVYTVPGMHCGHCERAVKDELQGGRGRARRRGRSGGQARVTVEGDGLEDTALREAIAEAGYEAA